jgi:hypothetical protein
MHDLSLKLPVSATISQEYASPADETIESVFVELES